MAVPLTLTFAHVDYKLMHLSMSLPTPPPPGWVGKLRARFCPTECQRPEGRVLALSESFGGTSKPPGVIAGMLNRKGYVVGDCMLGWGLHASACWTLGRACARTGWDEKTGGGPTIEKIGTHAMAPDGMLATH